MITSRTVTSIVEQESVGISVLNGELHVTVNGTAVQFPMSWAGEPKPENMAHTVKALKEAVARL